LVTTGLVMPSSVRLIEPDTFHRLGTVFGDDMKQLVDDIGFATMALHLHRFIPVIRVNLFFAQSI
jgi:hypothetical protein